MAHYSSRGSDASPADLAAAACHILLDSAGLVTSWSSAAPTALAALGWPPLQAGHPIAAILPDPLAAELRVSIAALSAGTCHHALLPIDLPSDGIHWHLALEALLTPDSKLGALLLTLRPAAENEFSQPQALLQAVLDNAPVSIEVVDIADGRYLLANKLLEKITGLTQAQLRTHTMADLYPPQLVAQWRAQDAKIAGSGQPIETEDTTTYSDGSTHTYVGTKFPITDSTGRIYAIGSIFTDITARKQTEAALAASEARYRTLLEQAADAIIVIERDGTISELNAQAATLLGLPSEQVRGRNVRALVQETDQQLLPRHDMVATGDELRLELRVRRFDATLVLVEAHVRVLNDTAIAIVRDITQRKHDEAERQQHQHQLQAAQRRESLGALASGIAHAFNNLLGIILGHTELAMLELDPNDAAIADLGQIKLASQRAAALVTQIRLYAGAGPLRTLPLDLPTLVRDMDVLLRAALPSNALLQLAIDPTALVAGDAVQLRQVVLNLMINATESLGAEGGTVRVATGALLADAALLRETHGAPDLPEGIYSVLVVSDTGIGLDAEAQTHLFEPFYTTKFLGRGLGLATVLGIVRAHGGAVRLVSVPQQGTSVTVLLPPLPYT